MENFSFEVIVTFELLFSQTAFDLVEVWSDEVSDEGVWVFGVLGFEKSIDVFGFFDEDFLVFEWAVS